MNITQEIPKETKKILCSSAKRKWSLLRNVVRAVALFKTYEVQEAEDVDRLVDEVKRLPTDRMYQLKKSRNRENSAYFVAIKDLRREQNLRKCVERGNLDDINQIKVEIDQDPYKLLRNSSHPLALINKRNSDGQTPLYIACKNGHLDVALLLLSENADYLMTSIIDNEEETNLEVAVRWGHTKIAQELLKLKWPKSVLIKAKALCRTSDMVALFKKQKKKNGCWCFSAKRN